MGWMRLVAAVGGVAVLAGAVAGVILATEGESGKDGAYPLVILGPGGEVLWNGTHSVDDATALSVLQAGTKAAGLTLQVETYPHIKPCGEYVRAIGTYTASGSGGWTYEVWEPSEDGGGKWVMGPYGAACYGLEPGNRVRWSWSGSA